MKSYDSIEEVREKFIALGFTEFDPPHFTTYDGVTTMFQKKYVDEHGVRYFIDAKVWDWSWTNKVSENFHVEFEGQYYQAGTHDAVNFTFIDWELEAVEEWINKLFELEMLEHYEKREKYE